jgi:hypothetical protein
MRHDGCTKIAWDVLPNHVQITIANQIETEFITLAVTDNVRSKNSVRVQVRHRLLYCMPPPQLLLLMTIDNCLK